MNQSTLSSAFRLTHIRWDDKAHQLGFGYALQDWEFEEKLGFSDQVYLALKQTYTSMTEPQTMPAPLVAVHLMLGVSYWKITASNDILVPYELSSTQIAWWKQVYTKGMGEFFFKNQLPVQPNLSFIAHDGDLMKVRVVDSTLQAPEASTRILVPFGGGKDSVVSVGLLQDAGFEATAFLLRPVALQSTLVEEMSLSSVVVDRVLDPKMLFLTKQGIAKAGHVPMTAIYSLIACFVAQALAFGTVVLSNERSASEGTVMYQDQMINHQWSKSYEAELAMQSFIAQTQPTIQIFSMLRPYSELQIVKRFVKRHASLLSRFSSCNRNFVYAGQGTHALWCGDCPKCAFVFLMLATVLKKKDLVVLFGKDLLEDDVLIPTFQELADFTGQKPFECVGTSDEVRYALMSIMDHPDWSYSAVIQDLRMQLDEIPEDEQMRIKQTVLQPSETDAIPQAYSMIRDQMMEFAHAK